MPLRRFSDHNATFIRSINNQQQSVVYKVVIMPSVNYLNKALQILSNRDSTKDAKLVARQILHDSGFTDKDICDCLKLGSTIRITIFEA
ncbi:hypothetical protein BM524_17240 [Alteromonas mediterranea]|jgi:hypothetical protein|uniref:Uncharacterized protein n=1 Tax=Alteromonas mediterranea TaxID=314275 RepID=A0AAC9JEF5_9ALTE|nr:hypothetical protein BM524_17240 [Alteromonas mediterranea]|tara:strand:- start:410 stop:676 length:267 start_codon:yes stop_codon:yes gene_type:complete